MQQDKLANFGKQFQIKTLSCLTIDRSFIRQVSDILLPEFFESDASQWVAETTIKYFEEYKTLPTLDVFKIKLADVTVDVLKTEIKECLRDVFKNTESPDLDIVKSEVLKFCKNQCVKRAIINSVDLLEKGEYEKIKNLVDDALKAGMNRDIGYDFLADIQARYTTNIRKTIPTPWPIINELADGGFGMGELILLVAPPGIGKSTCLMNIGAHAIQRGLNVVHYTMELSEAYTAQRYDALVTGIATQTLKYNIEEVEETLKKRVNGKLIIKYFPQKTVSINAIKAHVDQRFLLGEKVDLIIIDYADLLKASGKAKDSTHEDLGVIYGEIRGFAGEYAMPVFSASQSNRSSGDSEIVVGSQIAGSFEKLMIADFVISLARLNNDKVSGTGRFHIIKNRFGPDGMTLPSKINMSNGQMLLFEETSKEGKAAADDMKSGESIIRKGLAQKYKEIKKVDLG